MPDKIKVLICNEESYVLRSMVRALSDHNYEVVTLESLSESLSEVIKINPDAVLVRHKTLSNKGEDECIRTLSQIHPTPIGIYATFGNEQKENLADVPNVTFLPLSIFPIQDWLTEISYRHSK